MIYSRRMSTPRAFVKQNVCLLARFPFLPFFIGARVTHPFPYKTSCMPAHARPLARGHQAKYVLGPSVPSAIESTEVARERYYADSGISDSGAHSTLSPYFDGPCAQERCIEAAGEGEKGRNGLKWVGQFSTSSVHLRLDDLDVEVYQNFYYVA